MTERQMQFRVGAIVLLATSLGVALTVRFGDLQHYWRKTYAVRILLPNVSGLYASAPVTMYGLTIGRVSEIGLNPSGTGVVAILQIDDAHRLPDDSKVTISKALLGETNVEIHPGTSATFLTANARLPAVPAGDPMEMVARMELQASSAMQSLQTTSQEWQLVAANLNRLMSTNDGHLTAILERAATSITEFSRTMTASQALLAETTRIIADPENQRAMKQTLQSLPEMVQETRQTIVLTRQAVANIDRNLSHLSQVTAPIGERGPIMVAKLESSLHHLDLLLGELSNFSRMANTEHGTVRKLLSDPQLYDNLNRSSQSLAVLLKNAEPVIRDLQEFSDKLARNPEVIGVRGAVQPSSGLRDEEVLNPTRNKTAARGASPIH